MLQRSKVITFHFIFLVSLLVAFFHALYSDIDAYNTATKTKIAIEEVQKIAQKTLTKLHVDQIACLATNIYWEAGNEDINGKIAVARVVMNRIQHGFASTPCKVVYQSHIIDDKKVCQFSWTCTDKNAPNKSSNAYRQAEEIARKILIENEWSDFIPQNVLFFHAIEVNPLWKYKKFATIGNHIFYERSKK